jgi:hypothetical protein
MVPNANQEAPDEISPKPQAARRLGWTILYQFRRDDYVEGLIRPKRYQHDDKVP